jgi:protein-disulfide isomerase
MTKASTLRRLTDAAVIVCVLAITAFVVKRELFDNSDPASAARQPSLVSNWSDYDVGGSIVTTGDSNALHLVEFSDFQCPFCAALHAALDSVLTEQPGRIHLRYRHFPLEQIHPYAFAAAVAADCAGRQGAFKRYHDDLFTDRETIGVRSWTERAAAAGVADTADFQACMRDSTASLSVETDIAAALSLQLRGTPALLVGDKLVTGALSVSSIEELLRDARH